MDDMSSTLIPILVALGTWSGFFLPLDRKWRALLMLPFVLAASALVFWRIPRDSELEPYLDALSLMAAASLIVLVLLLVRRRRRGHDTV